MILISVLLSAIIDKMAKKKKKTGRPGVTKGELLTWLSEMRPFLVGGATLKKAIEKAGLTTHQSSIYNKYKLGGWFMDKINDFQAILGEDVNEAYHDLVALIKTKVKQEKILSRDEIRILEFVAEKHRTSQPFFVSRVETAKAKEEDFGKVVERPTININPPVEKKKKKKDVDAKPKPQPAPAKAEDSVQPDTQTVEGVEVPNEPAD